MSRGGHRAGLTARWTPLFTLSALALMPQASAAQTGIENRYETAPSIQSIDPTVTFSGQGQDNPPQIANPGFQRFVEGQDAVARLITGADIASEIGDPFGQLLANEHGSLPDDVDAVLKLIGDPAPASSDLPGQSVFIVHEAGQVLLGATPDPARNPRALIVRDNPGARAAIFIAPSMTAMGTLEVMAWDPRKKLFNYYERGFAKEDNSTNWSWKGDSSHAWQTETRDLSCFVCHRNGEFNMKEMRVPWQNWVSESATIKPESIPEDSPLRRNPLYAIEPRSPSLMGAENLEELAKQWIQRTNETKVSHYRAGTLDVQRLLEPFFRTTTLTLDTSVDRSDSIGGMPVRLPSAFFIDKRGLQDIGELGCEKLAGFPTTLTLERGIYRVMLEVHGFRLADRTGFEINPSDTHFAFITPVTPRVDFDMIDHMVRDAIVTRQTATNLMLLDVSNTVFSNIRQTLFDLLNTYPLSVSPQDPLDDALVAFFEAVAADPAVDARVRVQAEGYLHRANLSSGAFKSAACGVIDPYLAAITARVRAGDVADFFKLLASRYAHVRRSELVSLVESDLLLPQTDPIVGLVMDETGAVRPGT